MELRIDPELKKLCPPLSADEKKQLEENILAEGCRDALVVWNGLIVDGHNRYEICQRLGIEFQTKAMEFENIEQAKVWMINNQQGRRNLTDGWKWELSQEKKKLLTEKGKEKYESTVGRPEKSLSLNDNDLPKQNTADISLNDKTDKHNTQKEIANELGWSTGKVAQADVVWKEWG